MEYRGAMFINARNALLAAGAHARQMPYRVTVQARHGVNGGWQWEGEGNSVEYIAECWNDAKSVWGNARIINTDTGAVIFVG